jgi:hypothetical protein
LLPTVLPPPPPPPPKTLPKTLKTLETLETLQALGMARVPGTLLALLLTLTVWVETLQMMGTEPT